MSVLRALFVAVTVAVFCIVGLRSFSSITQPAHVAVAGTSERPGPKRQIVKARLTQNCRLSNLVGLTAQNPDGQDLGRLKNFIVDSNSGRVRYAVISSGGFLGFGKSLKVVPLPALSTATTKRGIVELGISQHRWQDAPPFAGDLAALNQRGRARGILDYYRQADYSKLMRQAGSAVQAQPALSRHYDATAAGVPADSASLELASAIVGQSVVDTRNQVLGKVSDLVLDVKGQRAAIAIVAGGHFLHRRHFAVALLTLRSTPGHELVVDADPKTFEPGTTFDQAGRNNEDGIVMIY